MKKIHLIVLMFLFVLKVSAQISQNSIETALDDNGRIKAGVSGSFDARGYSLTYGINNEPILKKGAPNVTQSFGWTSMGQIPGTNGKVNVVAVDDNGIVYIGGEFGWPHLRLARWDGISWESLGTFNGNVYTIAISGSIVYVGGAFIDVDGNSSIQKIAKWDGNSWSAMGSEFSGAFVNTVYAITISGSDVYVGGEFIVTISSVDYPHIAKWNGTAWAGVGSGVDGFGVRSLAVDSGGNIYAGGRFTNAGGSSANYIAKWNGTAWSNLGTGLNDDVYTVAVDGSGNVYAGGVFTQAGGSTAKLIAVWNGTAWSELGGGVTSSSSAVNSIHVNGSDVYVGGDFQSIGSNSISDIAKWNGSAWSSLGQGTGDVYSITSYNTDFYVGGNFSQAGNVLAYNIAKWDGFNWSPMGEGPTNQGGLTGNVYAIAVDGSDVYFGGDFTQAGGIEANYIVMWDGFGWVPLGSGTNGVNGTVYSIVAFGQNIYVGGNFGVAGGGTITSYIARWAKPSELDPTGGWHALEDGAFEGVNGIVEAIVYNPGDGLIYAGGHFTEAGGDQAYYLAKWDGSDWTPADPMWYSAVNNYVKCLAVNSSGDVFFGGGFTQVAEVSTNHIAKWDRTNFSTLGNGVDGDVFAIAVNGSDVYAGGQFNWSNSTYLNGIGKWDGSSWSALGDGIDGECYTLSAFGTHVYVGGSFSKVYNSDVDFVDAERIARWNGSSWSAVGDGTIGHIRALSISSSEGAMYVGGEFIVLGDYFTGSAYTAKFTDSENGMPVELTSFTAKVNNNNVKLILQTATEVNNYGFQVQRKKEKEKSEWETIGFVEGHGNSNSPKDYSFVDANVSENASYRLKQIDIDGGFEYSNVVEVKIEGVTEFKLAQNYPNPFNPSTTISFAIPNQANVKLSVYNALGEEVAELVNKEMDAGNFSVEFDASNLTSGIYFYSIRTEDFSSVKKMLLLK